MFLEDSSSVVLYQWTHNVTPHLQLSLKTRTVFLNRLHPFWFCPFSLLGLKLQKEVSSLQVLVQLWSLEFQESIMTQGNQAFSSFSSPTTKKGLEPQRRQGEVPELPGVGRRVQREEDPS